MATAAVGAAETRASIPAHRGLPVVGHLHRITRDGLIGHLLQVSRDFPRGIFKLKIGSGVAVFVTDPDLVAEPCDETRFRKMPGPGLSVVRTLPATVCSPPSARNRTGARRTASCCPRSASAR